MTLRLLVVTIWSAVSLGAIVGAAAEPAGAPLYHVTKTITLGAPDRWDYVVFDPSSDRVFVAHGTGVTVVDGATGALVGQIDGLPGGAHGTAISTATGHGYTDDGQAGIAESFDLKTLKPLHRIKTAPDADSILTDPKSGHIFVINGDSGSVTVIDPRSDTAIATVQTGGGLEDGVADGEGHLFINGAEKNELVRIDTAKNAIDARWPIKSCTSPHGMAMDTATRRLFISCENKILLAVNADNGVVIASLPIGARTDAARFDPNRHLVFSSNGEGTLSIIREVSKDKFVSLGDMKTAPGARTMALDPATGRIYLAAADILRSDPPSSPDGRPHVTYKPGSLKLLFLDPAP